MGGEREKVTLRSASHSRHATAATKPADGNIGARLLRSEFLVVILCAAYFAFLAPFTPGFASSANLNNLLLTFLPLLVVALGQTVVMISGGIDLSVTSSMALASITGAAIMTQQGSWLAGSPLASPIAILCMLLVGAAVGLMNGISVSRLRMPPFIVTLTSMIFFSGLAVWLTRSRNIGGLPEWFNAVGTRLWICVPAAGVIAFATHLFLGRSLAGRWLYATGQNPRAALISGVPVAATTAGAYVVSGFLAGAAAVLYTSQAESGSPVLGQRMLLDIIGASVIGGASLTGGKGTVLGTAFGVLFIKLLDNSLNLLDLSYFAIMMAKGAVILAAALADSWRNRDSE